MQAKKQNPMTQQEKIKEAYAMLQSGMPPSVVAQSLDIPIRDIMHMGDSRCV